jgi:hypothetical protein
MSPLSQNDLAARLTSEHGGTWVEITALWKCVIVMFVILDNRSSYLDCNNVFTRLSFVYPLWGSPRRQLAGDGAPCWTQDFRDHLISSRLFTLRGVAAAAGRGWGPVLDSGFP